MARHSSAAVEAGYEARERAVQRARANGAEVMRLRGRINNIQIPPNELWTIAHSNTALRKLGGWEFYIVRMDMATGEPIACGCQSSEAWCWHAGASYMIWVEVGAADDDELAARAVAKLAAIREAVRVETTDTSYIEHFEASLRGKMREETARLQAFRKSATPWDEV